MHFLPSTEYSAYLDARLVHLVCHLTAAALSYAGQIETGRVGCDKPSIESRDRYQCVTSHIEVRRVADMNFLCPSVGSEVEIAQR